MQLLVQGRFQILQIRLHELTMPALAVLKSTVGSVTLVNAVFHHPFDPNPVFPRPIDGR